MSTYTPELGLSPLIQQPFPGDSDQSSPTTDYDSEHSEGWYSEFLPVTDYSIGFEHLGSNGFEYDATSPVDPMCATPVQFTGVDDAPAPLHATSDYIAVEARLNPPWVNHDCSYPQGQRDIAYPDPHRQLSLEMGGAMACPLPTSPTAPSPLYSASSESAIVMFENTQAQYRDMVAGASPTAPMMPYRRAPESDKPRPSYDEKKEEWKAYQRHVKYMVPQKMYKPSSNSDKKRYVDVIKFEEPITFHVYGSQGHALCGVSVAEALRGTLDHLIDPDGEVFKGLGPSISVRINWPGYEPWSEQIPTRNWKNPPGPITRRKLAMQVAKRVEKFVRHAALQSFEEEHQEWRIDAGDHCLERLFLYSVHHVSKGSWQPQLYIHP